MAADHMGMRVLPIRDTQRPRKESRACAELGRTIIQPLKPEAFLVAQPIRSRNLASYPSASCSEAAASFWFVTTTRWLGFCGPTRE
jgi:hypothetical protein